MAIPVLIIGKSGMGKSASLREFKDSEVGIINVIDKELPFRHSLKMISTDNYDKIKTILAGATAKTLVIDDAGYLITNQFLNRHVKDGFQTFTDIGVNFAGLISYIKSLPNDKIVYIMMHEEENEKGQVRPKTVGKLLDEKIVIEGLFTIVLRADQDEGKYGFWTQSQGLEVTKTPMGMFEEKFIENDLKFVDNTIRDYYNLPKSGKEASKKEKPPTTVAS